jgi:hypothetical protein
MNSLQERESRILGVVAPSFSTIGIIWGGKGERELQVCGAKQHVKGESVNSKKDKTLGE